ncbi:uncharacterized protein BJ171DRAFT_489587 [Polychytrium aggregatum]|uniref:uncharacterized protein n=1 Tax=Polychytrium aggregatum TaxID=110093 RepID=UPI0022FDB919|nr:uncharacterized protein BJ171DRAFT_489587 [Polychytrium aggregatum]KAI9208653.1 hypothetical protein BJ171DRAFT_489587 [Polychytrium aggregatum]
MPAPRSVSEVFHDNTFYLPFSYGLVLLPVVYFAVPRLLPRYFSTSKAKAWILTMVAALTMTLGSLPVLWDFFTQPHSAAAWASLDASLSRGLCAFFITYVIHDLVLGHFFYPEHMDPWSGYFHHTLYTFLVFNIVRYRISSLFSMVGIMELPTLIMSLGCINKSLRNDALFGGSYLATRILFHIYCIYHFYLSFIPAGRPLGFIISVAVFPLHVMWFRGFIKQQLRLHRQRKEQQKQAALQAAPKNPEPKPKSNRPARQNKQQRRLSVSS